MKQIDLFGSANAEPSLKDITVIMFGHSYVTNFESQLISQANTLGYNLSTDHVADISCMSRRGATIPRMNQLLHSADSQLAHADAAVIDLGGNDLDDLEIGDEISCEILFALLHNIFLNLTICV